MIMTIAIRMAFTSYKAKIQNILRGLDDDEHGSQAHFHILPASQPRTSPKCNLPLPGPPIAPSQQERYHWWLYY
jgi:hypothetical protein